MMRPLRLALDFLSRLIRPPDFEIRVRGGVPTATRGSVARGFLTACGELLREHGIPSCTIRGYRRGPGVSLRFSAEVPEPLRQRLRNVGSAHGTVGA